MIASPADTLYNRMLRTWMDDLIPGPARHADWNRCAAEPAYFIDTYCKTYDPRTPDKDLADGLGQDGQVGRQVIDGGRSRRRSTVGWPGIWPSLFETRQLPQI